MNDAITLTGLVERYSPSGSEGDATAWLVERMKTLNYTDAFVDGAGNAVGVMGTGPKQAVLLGHIDTVPGEIPLRVGEGNLYGRGSVDAKGPLACFVDAVAQVGVVPGWQLVVIGAVEEERDSDGARYVVSRYKPEFTIIGEPNRWDRISLGYKGSAWAKVSVRRAQEHTSSGGQTACEAAVELWLAIKAHADSFNTDKSRAFDKVLVTLRGLESGSDGFEQWAQLNVGTRLPLDVSPGDWYGKLREIAVGASVEPRGFAAPAWECEKNTPLVRALLSSIRTAGGTPSFVYKSGTADLNIVAPVWKCPAVVYGPGDSALDHTPDEHISLEEYLKAVEVLAGALRICAK
jgi:LysW-gamma-L-lysine carboxypeptidase